MACLKSIVPTSSTDKVIKDAANVKVEEKGDDENKVFVSSLIDDNNASEAIALIFACNAHTIWIEEWQVSHSCTLRLPSTCKRLYIGIQGYFPQLEAHNLDWLEDLAMPQKKGVVVSMNALYYVSCLPKLSTIRLSTSFCGGEQLFVLLAWLGSLSSLRELRLTIDLVNLPCCSNAFLRQLLHRLQSLEILYLKNNASKDAEPNRYDVKDDEKWVFPITNKHIRFIELAHIDNHTFVDMVLPDLRTLRVLGCLFDIESVPLGVNSLYIGDCTNPIHPRQIVPYFEQRKNIHKQVELLMGLENGDICDLLVMESMVLDGLPPTLFRKINYGNKYFHIHNGHPITPFPSVDK